MMRKLEIYYKTVVLSAKANELSSINPYLYMSRFKTFMKKNVLSDPNYRYLDLIIDKVTKTLIEKN